MEQEPAMEQEPDSARVLARTLALAQDSARARARATG